MGLALKECLENSNKNYILPFFWLHGEEESKLREYVNAIYNANIRQMCLEARPHPEYAKEGWFKDVKIIIDEAKKLGMKIWILDDAHFPSGQAAGTVKNADPKLCKQFLEYKVVDTIGPRKQITVDIKTAAKHYDNPMEAVSIFGGGEKRHFDDDELFSVVAAKLDGKEDDIYHMDGELTDLTDMVRDGVLKWDVPAGSYRIFIIYKTRNGGGRSGYVNFLSKDSCRLQIDACYEPHLRELGDEFGSTILGFFSDEPEIGNVIGYSGSDAAIGNHKMPLPWSEEMPKLMEQRFGADYRKLIPALWVNTGTEEFTADIRVGFMDIVSNLCRKNFGEQLGQWCRDHGLKYIGHLVEDNGNSTKLGSSQGHYFRALWGQDFSGIDNIGSQVTEGGENISHQGIFGFDSDGTFFHHVLGRLATSLADLDPKKHGDSMCEIFGAYGWNEGTRMMKYEIDHFLVRGINHYVPHAFNPKEFPDIDCPPHFYAHGKNPLYKPFGELMSYTDRICHLISGGMHLTQVAVLYNAESEWSGMKYMDPAKVARKLDEAQIDFDIIPVDALDEEGEYRPVFDQNGLTINGHLFKVLIIPGSEYIPETLKRTILRSSETGLKIIFAQFAPFGYENLVTDLKDISRVVKDTGIYGAEISGSFNSIRIYNYEGENANYYLVSNESIFETYSGKISIPGYGEVYSYDAFNNNIVKIYSQQTEAGIQAEIKLEPYQMMVLAVTNEDIGSVKTCILKDPEYIKDIEGEWQISFCKNEDYPSFSDVVSATELKNILDIKPDFSGIIRYDTLFSATGSEKYIRFEDVYESAQVWINDKYAGDCLCPPYLYDVSGLLVNGENHIRIEVRTTLERLVHKLTGGMGFLGPEISAITPSGVIGKVSIYK